MWAGEANYALGHVPGRGRLQQNVSTFFGISNVEELDVPTPSLFPITLAHMAGEFKETRRGIGPRPEPSSFRWSEPGLWSECGARINGQSSPTWHCARRQLRLRRYTHNHVRVPSVA